MGNDGQLYNLHFVALFSQNVDALPVLLLHGRLGKFLDFLPIHSLLCKAPTPTAYLIMSWFHRCQGSPSLPVRPCTDSGEDLKILMGGNQ